MCVFCLQDGTQDIDVEEFGSSDDTIFYGKKDYSIAAQSTYNIQIAHDQVSIRSIGKCWDRIIMEVEQGSEEFKQKDFWKGRAYWQSRK